MNGIFSARPCQSAIRLMVGTHLLLTVQAGLVVWAGADMDFALRLFAAGTGLLGFTAFLTAVYGGSGIDGGIWRPRRGGQNLRTPEIGS